MQVFDILAQGSGNALEQAGSRCDNGVNSFAAVKFVEALLAPAKTGSIGLPESLVAPVTYR